MKVFVIGTGGREHALAWRLAQSPSVKEVHSAPGSPGLAIVGPCHGIDIQDQEAVIDLCRTEGFDFVVIGPENPLASGLADTLRQNQIAVFGPGKDGAQLESSKAWAKRFMARYNIPSARHMIVTDMPSSMEVIRSWGAPIVIKASGLAAGKGVTVAETLEEAESALEACFLGDAFGEAGQTVVIEEKLEGEEASVFAVTDGTHWKLLPACQDHKRAFDGDRGPNTGGMGAFSPTPALTQEMLPEVIEQVLEPTLEGLRREGIAYRGLLYLGLMMTREGPKVIEYNVRFGDPETQVVVHRVAEDFGLLLYSAARGELHESGSVETTDEASVCVVAASRGYPKKVETGHPIIGLDQASELGVDVFHAGTARRDGEIVTSGGRVLAITASDQSLQVALERCYKALENIQFEGMWYRRDIGHRALAATPSQ